ncbi:hypothetical protein FACS1894105_07950 [Clostridia bacterium]|nr:hypothetical protein FACS1894105_07950 [Clostridia bacterium]
MQRTKTGNVNSAKIAVTLFLTLTLIAGLLATVPLTASAVDDSAVADWENPFTDVEAGYYNDVAFVVQNGLIDGTSETTFSPNELVTRGLFVTALFRYDAPAKGPSTTDFTDVPLYEYYSDAVAWASSNGIVNGYGNGTFGTYDNITREQIAAILTRYMTYKKIDVSVPQKYLIFTDEDVMFSDEEQIADYAKNALKTLNKLGVIYSFDDGKIAPQRNETRVQVAEILHKFAEVTKSAEVKPAGGYSAERDLTEEDIVIFNSAAEKLTGVKYEPLKVATQVVAGTNYRFYCKAIYVTPGAEERYVYVTIFKPLIHTGEPAVITDITDV